MPSQLFPNVIGLKQVEVRFVKTGSSVDLEIFAPSSNDFCSLLVFFGSSRLCNDVMESALVVIPQHASVLVG